jgi:hypothetical protein
MKAQRIIQPWKTLFVLLMGILFLAHPASSSAADRSPVINLCNAGKTDMRVASFRISSFSFGCSALSKEDCSVQIWNWQSISAGDCRTYSAGDFHWNWFAVQIKGVKGNWYSPVYKEDTELLEGREGKGMSGWPNTKMCVKNDTYSNIYDRRLKGMTKAVNDEICSPGYSKVPVNLFVQTVFNLEYTISLD